MAVIEIAKIQVRRGQENQTGIPQLDGGEFAWAADTEKLYIGLRREDGGARDANVEILTENHLRNLFVASIGTATNQIQYTYLDGTGITAYGTGDEVVRTLQDSLDDRVSVKAFDVTGSDSVDDGTNWDLRLLQNAIDKLFLNTLGLDPHPAKSLFFPAGTYLITSTLYIPARTTIIGEGPGKTIFKLTDNVDAMFKTCDAKSIGGDDGYLDFDSNGGEGADFDSTSSAKLIHIEGVTLAFDPGATTVTSAISALSLDCADKALIRNVEFTGNFSTGTYTESGYPDEGYVGINIRSKSSDSLRSENVIIDNCSFDGFYHAITSDYDVIGTMIENSEFKNLVRGISFNDEVSGTAQYGVTNARIVNNKFDYIAEEAIYVGDAPVDSNVTSMNNYFQNVGNYFEDNYPATGTSIITFVTEGNVSINDRFTRFDDQQALNNTPGADTVTYHPLITGRTSIDDFYVSTDVLDAFTTTVFLRMPITDFAQHLDIKYSGFIESGSYAVTTVAVTTGTSTIIEVASTANIYVGSVIAGPGIETGTEVIEVNEGYLVIDPEHTGVTAGDPISLVNTIDRMGELTISVQQGASPNTVVVDNYNYIESDGGISFGVNVNPTHRYYEVYGSVSLPISVKLEYRTNLTI